MIKNAEDYICAHKQCNKNKIDDSLIIKMLWKSIKKVINVEYLKPDVNCLLQYPQHVHLQCPLRSIQLPSTSILVVVIAGRQLREQHRECTKCVENANNEQRSPHHNHSVLMQRKQKNDRRGAKGDHKVAELKRPQLLRDHRKEDIG